MAGARRLISPSEWTNAFLNADQRIDLRLAHLHPIGMRIEVLQSVEKITDSCTGLTEIFRRILGISNHCKRRLEKCP